MSATDRLLTVCECCEGTQLLTAVELTNRPGLDALVYRVGSHASFKQSMLASISTRPVLRNLTTRQDDDPSIAVIDAWATVLDVLTFYQERIANEGFLRTAIQRRSILELARMIGYELRPGVAASTYLAFTLDDTEQAPRRVTIDVGTRAQSVPAKDELPQTFETTAAIEARPAWNALRPRRAETQVVGSPIERLVLAGADLGLHINDWILAVDSGQQEAFKVVGIAAEIPPPGSTDVGRTTVDLARLDPNVTALSPGYVGVPASINEPPGPLPFNQANVDAYVLGNPTWTAEELQARVDRLGWTLDQLGDHLSALPRRGPTTGLEIYALRVKASLFGHNAPLWATIPEAWRTGTGAPYPTPWEGSAGAANEDSQGNPHDPPDGPVIYLADAQPDIRPDSWLVLREGGTAITRVYQVIEAEEESRADYGISGKATRLELDRADDLLHFEVRNTTIRGGSERLHLAALPINDQDVAGQTVELDGFALGLVPGQQVVVRGERSDLTGVEAAEVRTLAEVVHVMSSSLTRLEFEEALEHAYRRPTVAILANTAPATHGESRSEVLGSGAAGEVFQRFTLRHRPLTYVPAPVPSGGVSTLELRVNGVRWHEAPDLYQLGPNDRRYVLRQDDDGLTSVLFGDGRRGARLPTGIENVTARYRSGVGLIGQVDADRITLLATQPLGVRGVTNPVPATGADDPETMDGARRNAPLTVLTLDRIVSLRDFEDFARAFSGVGKARADWLWDGQRRVVHLTITGADGSLLAESADLIADLRAAMDDHRDPLQPVVIGPFQPLGFRLEAQLRIDPDHESDVVLADVETALADAFAFERRDLAQLVAASEVVTVMQERPGVIAVDLDVLERSTASAGGVAARLIARPARLGPPVPSGPNAGTRPLLGAELLTLAPGGAQLGERT